jgi:hypothetical protein
VTDPSPLAGIDAGASLWKLVRIGEDLETAILPMGTVELSGREALFLPHGAFCGAVGAALGEV